MTVSSRTGVVIPGILVEIQRVSENPLRAISPSRMPVSSAAMIIERRKGSACHSLRRATAGSTRAARNAGTKHARAATPMSVTDTTAIVVA